MSYYRWDSYDDCRLEDMVGKTISRVEKSSNEIDFFTECGEHYKMYHQQDCCESVYIDAIDGDLNRLVGGVVYSALEDVGAGPSGEYGESVTWSYYRIRTDKEFVHITWRGSSNGYYSERVSFIKFKQPETDEEVE